MLSSKTWFKALLTSLTIVVIAGVLFLPLPVLEVIKDNSANQVLLIPLAREEGFSLEYVHSVQKCPVRENFVIISEDRIKLVSTTYQSLGVGLPFLPSEGQLVNNQGTFELTGLNRVFREIRLAVMPVTYQGLVYKDQSYVLSDYFSAGSLVTIRVQSYSPGYLIWHKITAHKGGLL